MSHTAQSTITTATTVSKFQKGVSGCATWQLKEWSECHKYLAAKCSCILKVGDATFRFFLRPIQKTFCRKNKVMLCLDYYSLWAEVISDHTNLFFNVMTILAPGDGEKIHENDVETFDTQIVLNRQSSEDNGMLLIEEQFICMQQTHTDLQTLLNGFSYRTCKNRTLYAIRTTEFNIDITVTLYQAAESENVTSLQKLEAASSLSLSSDIVNIFDDTDCTDFYHDVSLKMKDDVVLKGHRFILAARSPVFRAMFSSGMKESAVGSCNSTVDIPDIGSEAMKVILNYMYTERIDKEWKTHVDEVVHGASKYDLKTLLDYCEKNMIKICTVHNAIDLFRVAKLYSLKGAMDTLTEFTQNHTAQVLLCMGGD